MKPQRCHSGPFCDPGFLQFPPLLDGDERTHLPRSEVVHESPCRLVQMLVAATVRSSPCPGAGRPPHTRAFSSRFLRIAVTAGHEEDGSSKLNPTHN